MALKVTCIVLVLSLCCVSLSSAEWSWGKKPKDQESNPEEHQNQEQQQTSETREDRAIALEKSVIPEGVLPLESFETHAELQAALEEAGVEEGRSGRIFGIPEKLCKLGIKGMCNKKGYPPVELNQYGQPIASSYQDYEDHAAGYEIHTQNTYQVPHAAAPLPAYQPPQKNVGFKHTNFNQQSQVHVPKPIYPVPTPTYTPPKVEIIKEPAYSHIKHTSQHQLGQSNFVKKTSASHINPKPVVHQKIETKIVPSVSEVHYHTHNHVYGDKQKNNGIGRIGSSQSQITEIDAVPEVSTHFQVINKHPKQQERYPPLNQQGGSFSHGNFAPSQPAVPYINTFETAQDKRQISQSSSTIQQSFHQGNGHVDTVPSFNPGQTATGFHGSSSLNGFHAGNAKDFGVVQDNRESFFTTNQVKQGKELHSSSDRFSTFAQNGLNQQFYQVDCHCVPYQYCAPNDLVARSDPNDFSQLLDARNLNNDVLANSTLSEDYYDYDVFYDSSNETESNSTENEEKDEQEEIETTTLALKEVEDVESESETKTPDTQEGKTRRRRDAKTEGAKDEEKSNLEGLEGRQLVGYTPGINGCGRDHVCCRRPVYKPPKPLPICGKANPSIHGRVATVKYENGQSDFGEYPWQGALLEEKGEDSMFKCGATLIDERHLLTAAHCVDDGANLNGLFVRLGEWDVNRDTEFYTHVEIPVANVIIHPEFYKGNLYNDIAVIRLAYNVDITSNPHISPVCLPSPKSDFTNHRCQVTGWGKDAFGDNGNFQHILKELELPIVDRYVCENALRTTRLGRQYRLHDGFICAGGEFGKDACKGDGGGPLVCSTSDKIFELAGIVSWGIGCGQEGVPGVYVNIPYYVDWIKAVTKV